MRPPVIFTHIHSLRSQADTKDNLKSCEKNFERWLPLFGQPAKPPSTSREIWKEIDQTKSNYVCVNHAVAGLGQLTDHGMKSFHGRIREDYQSSANVGRGPMLYDFRNYMLDKVNLPRETKKDVVLIVFSINSSTSQKRNLAFKKQIARLKALYTGDAGVSIVAHKFSDMTVQEQVLVATQTSILVTSAGGGAMTGMFMDRGSSVIIYYDETGHDGSAVGQVRVLIQYSVIKGRGVNRGGSMHRTAQNGKVTCSNTPLKHAAQTRAARNTERAPTNSCVNEERGGLNKHRAAK